MNLDDVEKVVAVSKRCGGHEDGLDFFLFSVNNFFFFSLINRFNFVNNFDL